MDASPFRKLALAELEPVHRLAYHLCRDCHETEDLVQETYLRAFRSSGTFVDQGVGIRPWLFKILNNVIKTRRASLRRQRHAYVKIQRQVGKTQASPTTLSNNKLNWEELDERLFRAIHALPVPHRVVVLLSAVEEMTYREIADVVGLPIGTVMSRLSRARKVLAAELQGLAGDRNILNRTNESRPKADAEPAV